MSIRLSVALIARDEASQIAECLAAVAFADEIVVVEHGSRDDTAAQAEAAGARVIRTPDWPGFGAQKNRAIDACRGEWILSIDADERVGTELREEILAVLAAPHHEVYAMPRRSLYLRRFMRHGGWWPDPCARLFRRGSARFSDAAVHERLIHQGTPGRLHAPLIHYSFRSAEQVLEKVDRYSSDGARMLAARGGKGSLRGAIAHGAMAFARTYLLRGAWRDGRYGFMLAVSNAEGAYYKQVKCMLLDESIPPAPR